MNLVQWIGYAASACILISLTMTNIVKLRIVNTIGCLLYVVYGVLLDAYPVAIPNFIIIFINLYNLYKLKKNRTLDNGEKN